MIANPEVAAGRPPAARPAARPAPAPTRIPAPTPVPVPTPASARPTAPAPARPAPPQPAAGAPPTGTRPLEAPDTEAVAVRARRLAAHGHNPLLLDSGEADIDLVTDSWTELDTAYVAEGMAELRAQTAARPGPAEDLAALLPFRYVVPTLRGRSAEALLCRAWPGGADWWCRTRSSRPGR